MRKHAIITGTLVVFLGPVLLGQTKPAASVQGVWRVTEIVVSGGPNAGTVTMPQPGFFMFTRSHYSTVRINGNGPRPKYKYKDPAKPTDAEKLAAFAQWDRLAANSGTYQVAGTTIRLRPLVAKAESVMAGPELIWDFKLDGNTLWLTGRTTAKPPIETRYRLTREE